MISVQRSIDAKNKEKQGVCRENKGPAGKTEDPQEKEGPAGKTEDPEGVG